MVEAENALGLKFVLRDVLLRAIDASPELARELMAPAKAIKEIRVLQTSGMGNGGGSNGGQPALGAMSPILKSVLEAGAAYPMLRELMNFAKLDGDKLGDKAQSLLSDLSGELGGILRKEEGLSSNDLLVDLEPPTGRSGAIKVTPVAPPAPAHHSGHGGE
jgi:hypothetical protein